MQLASRAHIPEGRLAAMTPLNEKPRHGATSKNPAPYPGIRACNSTTAIEVSSNLAPEMQWTHAMGRWLSPDPYDGSYDISDPQSFNRYAYVANNPLSFIDQFGLEKCIVDGIERDICPVGSGGSGGAGGFPIYTTGTCPSKTGDDGTTVYSPCLVFAGFTSFGSGTGARGGGGAPNNPVNTFLNYEKRVIACNLSTAKKNAVAIGLDAVGFIPGEKLLGATGGVIAMVGIGVVSTANSAIHGDTIGFFGGQAGTLLAAIAPAAKYAGVSAAESIPGIGTAINIGVTARDIYHGQQDYNACMAGH